MKHVLIFSAIIAVAFSGCTKTSSSSSSASGVVYMWIGPVADTKLDADNPDQNFVKSGDNTVARYHIPGSVAWHVTSYIKFELPQMPAGTKIDEAYFEMFHSGTTEDGTSDNVRFLVSPINATWRADSVTWNNSPDGGAITNGASPFSCILHSNDWCGTTNIDSMIIRWFADTGNTKGFGLRVTTADPSTYYKSFYSNNSFIGAGNKDGRTDSTLGKAPRLLIKIELPAGKTTNDFVWKTIPLDYDIPLGSFTARTGYIYLASYRTGSDWPTEWGVKKGK